jgi:hypothetical protein
MNMPKYPDDFFDFGNGVDISNDEINKWIKEMVDELEENNNCHSLGRSTGNTYVRVNRDDCTKYRVLVTKNYQEKDIY